MSIALRPILRPSSLPSLPAPTSTPTYVCQSCRHARLLRRPKRPYTFTQLITLSDGSAFTIRTTSPQPIYRSTRDTRNSPLWNPSSKELLNVEEDEAGRLAGFRARFGMSFDAKKDGVVEEEAVEGNDGVESVATSKQQQEEKMDKSSDKQQRQQQQPQPEKDEFEEDDLNLLELISSYGQDTKHLGGGGASAKQPKGKKGK